MNIKMKKLRKNCWEMRLVFDSNESYPDQFLRQQLNPHDSRVTLINEELTASDFTMYSRKSYDCWHWYDEAEMNRFVTSFLLKNT